MTSPRQFYSPWFWFLFLLLTLTNVLISLETLPSLEALGLALLGVIPLCFLLTKTESNGIKKDFFSREEFLPGIQPRWVWGLLAAAWGLRLWKFGNQVSWPTGDEALTGLMGIEWSHHWVGPIFYTAGQDPPTLFWLTGIFFRFIHNPTLDLWLPPVLVSCLAVTMVYFASRRVFTKSFSFLITSLWAFSYWPLQLGQTDLPACFTALWVPVTFYFLAGFWKATGSNRAFWVLGAGLVLGLNWLTFTSWPFFVLAAGTLLAVGILKEKKKKVAFSVLASIGFFLGILPFLVAAEHSDFGRHIADVAFWNGTSGLVHQARVALNYISVLGWGAFSGDRLAAPLSGGYLNPLLVSFCGLGLAGMTVSKEKGLRRWFGFYAILTLLPGMLSLNLNGDRIVQILPLLILVSAWGFAVILKRVPEGGRINVMVLLLLVCLTWDKTRLDVPGSDPVHHPAEMEAAGKSVARYRAFQILHALEQKEGPGWILGEWDVPADRTLEVMTYYFNSERGAISVSPAWLAVMTDAHYLPFLKTRFPDGDWRVLDADVHPESPRLLGILKINDSNRAELTHWAKADPGFTLINWDLDHLHDRGLQQRFDQDVQKCGNWVKDDPFLAAMFWEKAGATYYYFGQHYPQHLAALENAVKYGYPASHLYGELASLYWVAGNKKAAEVAALKAKESDAKYPWH